MDTQNVETKEVSIYEKSIATFTGGAAILANSQDIATKAETAGKRILDLINENGGKLNPEIDKLCNDYIAKCNTRKGEMESARKPITQIMDEVKKLFIAQEKKIDAKDSNSIASILQTKRNEYAKQVAEEERKRREEAEKRAQKEREAVQLRTDAQSNLDKYFGDYLFLQKQKLSQLFNNITLEDFAKQSEALKNFSEDYPVAHYEAFNSGLFARHHTKEEISSIVAQVCSDKFKGFSASYQSDMQEMKRGLIDRLPSLKEEMENMAKADAENKKRLEEERKRREQEEEERLRRERAEKEEEDRKKAEAAKAEGETMVMFNQEAEVASTDAKPETREAYEITVTHPVGYMQIFQFWFEHEGKTLPNDKIEKKSIAQMKSFCEKKALKDSVFIESAHVEYKEKFTAVNRK